MKIMDKIDISITIETLHRYVFDNIYIQNKSNLTLEEENILIQYKNGEKILPNWRQILKWSYKRTKDLHLKSKLKKKLKVRNEKYTRYGNLGD